MTALSFLLSPEEQFYLSQPHNTSELSLLDTNTTSRLQIILFQGIRTLKSVSDPFRKIRICLAALLVKAYSKVCKSSERFLNKLKALVFRAGLSGLTESKGIEKEQLLKSFAEHLRNIPIGFEAEPIIIKTFNCAPFFDQIIMLAIQEQYHFDFMCDISIQEWLQKEFDIKLLFNEDTMIEEAENEMGVIGLREENISSVFQSENCSQNTFTEYLRFSSQVKGSLDESGISDFYDRQSKGLFFDYSMSPLEKHPSKHEMSKNLLLSIESISISPSLYESKENNFKLINSPKNAKVGLFDSVNTVTFRKSKKLAEKEIIGKTIKVRRSGDENESILWNLFCCSFGRQ